MGRDKNILTYTHRKRRRRGRRSTENTSREREKQEQKVKTCQDVWVRETRTEQNRTQQKPDYKPKRTKVSAADWIRQED